MKFFFLFFFFLSQAQALELMTYNLGLAKGFVDYYEERREPVFSNLKNSKADVLCLQELWKAEDREKLAKELAATYPYKIIPPIERAVAGSSPACGYSDLFGEGSIVSCMRTRCHGKTGREFTACIIGDCKKSLESLKKNNSYCANALMAQVGHSPFIVMLQLLQPFWPVDLYTYEGSNGLALFSKYPFKTGTTGMIPMRYYSTLTRRDFLYATLEADGKELFVGCTHLTANFTDTVPYAGPFANWEQENLKQTELILSKLESLAKGKPQAIMGDFNSSPVIPNYKIDGNFERTYSEFKKQGYLDPASEGSKPGCTICKSNSLNLPTDPDQLIDHIFLKNIDQKNIGESQVLMDQKIEINKSIKTNLSDHYALKVIINLP